jgi:hypothetical protein
MSWRWACHQNDENGPSGSFFSPYKMLMARPDGIAWTFRAIRNCTVWPPKIPLKNVFWANPFGIFKVNPIKGETSQTE